MKTQEGGPNVSIKVGQAALSKANRLDALPGAIREATLALLQG